MATSDSITPEEWRPVAGFVGVYEVSNLGRVRGLDHLDTAGRLHRGKPLGWTTKRRGYRFVRLYRDGMQFRVAIHHMVLRAFVGPCPEGMQGCHWDDDLTNNALSNLRWDTPKGNAADRERNGRTARGERSAMASLTSERVIAIRDRYLATGDSPTLIAEQIGSTPRVVQAVVSGETWRHLLRAGELERLHAVECKAAGRGERNGSAKLSWEKVRAIRAREGEPRGRLAVEFGVSRDVIWQVQTRRTWRESTDPAEVGKGVGKR